jgi:hypothetical protein
MSRNYFYAVYSLNEKSNRVNGICPIGVRRNLDKGWIDWQTG